MSALFILFILFKGILFLSVIPAPAAAGINSGGNPGEIEANLGLIFTGFPNIAFAIATVPAGVYAVYSQCGDKLGNDKWVMEFVETVNNAGKSYKLDKNCDDATRASYRGLLLHGNTYKLRQKING